MNTLKETHYLTHGSITKKLLKFALPFLLASFLQAGYGAADMLIISHFGTTADLSGVTNGSQIMWTLMCLVSGLTMGGTILVGQFFGAKQLKDVQETIGTIFTLFFWVSFIMTALCVGFSVPITSWIQVPPESFHQAWIYTYIGAWGLFFTFGYNAVCAILRGLGDSKNPLIFISIASIFNVILDFIFIAGFHWGAAGASLATTLAQGVSFIIAIWYLKKKNFMFDVSLKSFIFVKEKAWLLLKVGIPVSLQDTLLMFSFLVVLVIVNKMGVVVSAATGITEKIDGLTFLPTIAIASAVSAMVAQNIGARKLKRAREIMFTGIFLSLIFGIPSFILVRYFPSFIMSLTSSNPAIIQAGSDYLFAYSPDCLLLCIVFSVNAFLNGCGRTTFTMLNNTFANICVRIPLVYIATDLSQVGWAFPITALFQITIALLYFYSGYWKKPILKKNVSKIS